MKCLPAAKDFSWDNFMYILIVGAHPDDGESSAGGAAALWRRRGDEVRFISVTDGRRGHYDQRYADAPQELVARRRAESLAAADVIGATYGDIGAVEGPRIDDTEYELRLMREIRLFGPGLGAGPDLVVTHRPQDHPRDHRLAAHLTIDACGMAALPLVDPDTPPLKRTPPIAYWFDDYTEISSFRPDVVVAIDAVIKEKTAMLAAHASQVFEWMPYYRGIADQIPADPDARLAWLAETQIAPMAGLVRAAVMESLHSSLPHGRYVEAFQISEYGRPLSDADIKRIFPVG